MCKAPLPLGPEHDLAGFDCGSALLNDWLKRHALANQHSGASRTFVATDAESRVLGYYALAAGAAAHRDATGAVRRNMPDPIPVMVLARLAIDQQRHGQALGASLLKDAVLRCQAIAENAGVRAVLVHALDERAKAFYLRYGFSASPVNPMTLMLRLPTHGRE